MTAQQAEKPAKKPARVVVPFRVAPAGKEAMIEQSKKAGYENYTEWIRDVLAREVAQPRVKKGPKK